MTMLKYFYDKEADIFYFSQGTPSAFDQTIEAGDDVLLRISPRTKRVRGFTLLNASRKTRNAPTGVPFTLVPNVSVRA